MAEQLDCPECNGVESKAWFCSVCKDKGKVTVGREVDWCSDCGGRQPTSFSHCYKCRGKRVVRK